MKRSLFALLVCSAPAFADISAGTPHFAWNTVTPKAGALPFEKTLLVCNGELKAVVPWPTREWQSAPGDFAPGNYTCTAMLFDTAGSAGPVSNSVTYTLSIPHPSLQSADADSRSTAHH